MRVFRAILFSTICISWFFVGPKDVMAQNATSEPRALRLILSQGSGILTLKDISLENTYPSDYKLQIPRDYYTVKIIGSDRSILFSGRVARKRTIYPPPPQPGEDPGRPIEDPMNEFSIYLPYFETAERIVFADERGNTVLTVYLKDYDLKNPLPTGVAITLVPGKPTCDVCGFCEGGTKPRDWEQCNACTAKPGFSWLSIGCVPINLASATQTLLQFVIGISGGIAFLAILYGSFLIMTSKGEKHKLRSGKQIIMSSIVALLLIFFSVGILKFIGVDILALPAFK